MSEVYIYTGAIHIHSTYSDGSKPISEIASIASSLDIDYLLMADHNTLVGKDRGEEKRYGNTHVLIGYEINDPEDENYNHYLAFNLDKVLPADLTPKEYVSAVKENGGIGFIAHPDEIRGNIIKDFPGNPWVDWDVEGFDGIEIWNQMSEWMERLTSFNKLWMAVSPRKGIYQPPERTLTTWDVLNRERRVAGIAGIDVHAMPYKIGPFTLTFFPYKVQFQSIRTNLVLREPLSDDFQTAKNQIYTALKGARCYLYNQRWGEVSNNPYYILRKNGDSVIQGEEIEFEEGMRILVDLPKKGIVRILRYGKVIHQELSDKIDLNLKKNGNYRMEVYRKNHGWLFTNNIYVR